MPGQQVGTCSPWGPESEPPSPLPKRYPFQAAHSQRRRPPRPMNLPSAVMRSASMGALATQLGAPADADVRMGTWLSHDMLLCVYNHTLFARLPAWGFACLRCSDECQ